MNKEDFFDLRLYQFFVFLQVCLLGYLLFIVLVEEEEFFFFGTDRAMCWAERWRKASHNVRNATIAITLNTAAMLFFGYQYWDYGRTSVPIVTYEEPFTQESQGPIRVDNTKTMNIIEKAVTRLENEIGNTTRKRADLIIKMSTATGNKKHALKKKMELVKRQEKRNKEKVAFIDNIINNMKNAS